MNPKNTLFWVLLASGLFAFIFLYERQAAVPDTGPVKVLPGLKAAAGASIQVRPAGTNQVEIRAERANGPWMLTEPLVYPARAGAVENLLAGLEKLTPATYIAERDISNRTRTDEEFGFKPPQASLIFEQGGYRRQ